MNMDKKRLEGPFHTSPSNKCDSCKKIIEDQEYRRNYNEELYRETGGKEGRITYCVPCGEKIRTQESIETVEEQKRIDKEQKKINKKRINDAQETIKDCFAILDSLAQRLFQENAIGTKEDYKKIKEVQKKVDKLNKENKKWNNSLIKTDLENLRKYCQDLINEYISPKDRYEVNNEKNRYNINRICCHNIEIKFDENNQEYYCDYC